jgi:hypothetical protein
VTTSNYAKPIAKWQSLIAKRYGMPDVLKMTYNDARNHLATNGFRLVFANTVRGLEGGMIYVAIIEGPDDWVAFFTEAVAQWKRNVRRFTYEMHGRKQIEEVMQLGTWRPGLPVTQSEAMLLAQAAIFTREQGGKIGPKGLTA